MIEYFNEDCMAGMARYPDKHFDLAIVDPPYGIGAGKEKPHNGWKDYGIKQWDSSSPEDEYGHELPAYETPYNYCPNCGRKLRG